MPRTGLFEHFGVWLETLTRWATGRNVIIFFLLVVGVNLSLPYTYPTFTTLDFLTRYTPAEAYQMLTSFEAAGRQQYLIAELTLDLVYPPISALFFMLFAIFIYRRAFPPASFVQKLPLLGLLVWLSDYLENAGIVTMLLAYPRQLDWVARLTPAFTSVKMALSYGELLLLAIGLVGWLVSAIIQRRRKA